MNTLKNTRSSLFLMELIIAILFFSIGSAVCVQAFVQAHLTSREARDLSFASSGVSSAASVVRYAGSGLSDLQAYYPSAVSDGDETVVYYDSGFDPCGGEDAAYALRILTARTGGAENAHIRMLDAGGELIYELELRYPVPGQE